MDYTPLFNFESKTGLRFTQSPVLLSRRREVNTTPSPRGRGANRHAD